MKLCNIKMKNNEENAFLIKGNKISETNKLTNSGFPINNEINLVFRNQLSSDTILQINKSKISSLKISDIIDLLLSKLNKFKSEYNLRLFFKGRPLNPEEKMKDLGKKIIKLEYNIIIIIFIYKL